MAEITARGHIPLLVGGTMLYFKALREGLNDLPQADPALRAELEARAAKEGWPALHRELAGLDPETAARLQPTDAQRIQRALEVCLLSGTAMSALLANEQQAELPYRLIQLALLPSDRAVLHERIAQRFDAMLKQGLLDELQSLRARYELTPNLPSMRCVGYRQAWQYLEGECDAAEMRELGIIATRQLAKRQLTWLRGMEGVAEFDCLDDALANRVLSYISAEIS
jgi:tRNA dimethylallyltransferase